MRPLPLPPARASRAVQVSPPTEHIQGQQLGQCDRGGPGNRSFWMMLRFVHSGIQEIGRISLSPVLFLFFPCSGDGNICRTMNLGPLFKERNGGTLAFRIRGVRSCAVLKTRHCGLDIHVCGHSLLQDPRDPGRTFSGWVRLDPCKPT